MSDIFTTLEKHMKASTIRHGVIASNIANIDTPGYQARDVKFSNALSEATLQMRATDPRHMSSPDLLGGVGSVSHDQQSPWGDRNNVEIDVEVAKMTENSMFFQAASTILSKNITMYKTALRRS